MFSSCADVEDRHRIRGYTAPSVVGDLIPVSVERSWELQLSEIRRGVSLHRMSPPDPDVVVGCGQSNRRSRVGCPRKIRFRYPARREAIVFRNFDLKVESGSTVALVSTAVLFTSLAIWPVQSLVHDSAWVWRLPMGHAQRNISPCFLGG